MIPTFKILLVAIPVSIGLLTANAPATIYVKPEPGEVVYPKSYKNPLEAFIRDTAIKAGVPPEQAVFIVSHESQFNPNAIGDGGQSRGLWQISRIHHPEVSDDCAFDPVCSTIWSVGKIRDGEARMWSAWRLKCPLYGVCMGNEDKTRPSIKTAPRGVLSEKPPMTHS